MATGAETVKGVAVYNQRKKFAVNVAQKSMLSRGRETGRLYQVS